MVYCDLCPEGYENEAVTTIKNELMKDSGEVLHICAICYEKETGLPWYWDDGNSESA